VREVVNDGWMRGWMDAWMRGWMDGERDGGRIFWLLLWIVGVLVSETGRKLDWGVEFSLSGLWREGTGLVGVWYCRCGCCLGDN
jgi:hypothetical protein